jgi:hypothetical protein
LVSLHRCRQQGHQRREGSEQEHGVPWTCLHVVGELRKCRANRVHDFLRYQSALGVHLGCDYNSNVSREGALIPEVTIGPRWLSEAGRNVQGEGCLHRPVGLDQPVEVALPQLLTDLAGNQVFGSFGFVGNERQPISERRQRSRGRGGGCWTTTVPTPCMRSGIPGDPRGDSEFDEPELTRCQLRARTNRCRRFVSPR